MIETNFGQNNCLIETYFKEASELAKKHEKKSFNFSKPLPPLCSIPTDFYHFEKKQNKVVISLPKEASKQRNFIYCILQISEKAIYIGKTEQTLASRVSSHLSLINSKNQHKSTLHERIFAQPDHFALAILYQLKPKEHRRWVDSPYDTNIDLVEKKFIKFYQRQFSLMNQNKGGGGGRSLRAEQPSYYAVPKNLFHCSLVASKIRMQSSVLKLTDPLSIVTTYRQEKERAHAEYKVFGCIYIFKRKEKKLSNPDLQLFCSGSKRARESMGPLLKKYKIGASYLPKYEEDFLVEEEQTVTHYIGMAANPLKRINTHLTKAKKYLSPNFSSQYICDKMDDKKVFIKELATNFNDFEVSVLPIKYLKPSQLSREEQLDFEFFTSIAMVEKYVIKLMRENGPVYNQLGGGNGSIASELCQSVFPIPFKM